MRIRHYTSSDCPEIIELFYNTVHTVNRKDYNPAQLDAWAPQEANAGKWDTALSANYTLVIEDDNHIIGFGDIDKSGYFDHLFIHKEFQGRGLATLLAVEIENYARENAIPRITTEASITAKSFFLRRGYAVIREQTVERKGQRLINYYMAKEIT